MRRPVSVRTKASCESDGTRTSSFSVRVVKRIFLEFRLSQSRVPGVDAVEFCVPSTSLRLPAFLLHQSEIGRRDLMGAAICGSICAYGVRPHSMPRRVAAALPVPMGSGIPRLTASHLSSRINKVSSERFHEIETGRQWRIQYRLSSCQM